MRVKKVKNFIDLKTLIQLKFYFDLQKLDIPFMP